MQNDPFFIVGCVRSGTTFLRDVLRMHSNFASPEETHFYRWAEPFGSLAYKRTLLTNKVLINHRKIDGIEEAFFEKILGESKSCAEFSNKYMEKYIEINKPAANRWFDKTPQNVYGVAKILRDFPDSKIIEIVRHPLDVITSLKIGKIVSVPEIVGACHYWLDAVANIELVKNTHPERVYILRYEDLIQSPEQEIRKLLAFLDESPDVFPFSDVKVSGKIYQFQDYLTSDEIEIAKNLCDKYCEGFTYSFDVDQREGSRFHISLPSLQDATDLLDKIPLKSAFGKTVGQIPRRLVTIERHVTHADSDSSVWNKRYCEDHGVEYLSFNEASMRNYLVDITDKDYSQIFDEVKNADIRADLFKLVYLSRDGGVFVDSTMKVRSDFIKIFDAQEETCFFKWEEESRRNICSWLIGAKKGSKVIEYIADAVAKNISDAHNRDEAKVELNKLSISGPGAITRALAAFIMHGKLTGPTSLIGIYPVNLGYHLTQPSKS